jgi:tRNA-uridine 2-sulfurtransferase
VKGTVAVAMSGGVDSSVAACLLLKQGYKVVGLSMKLPYTGTSGSPEEGCCGVSGIDDARDVAGKLGIPFYALDYGQEFRREVIDYFCGEYSRGRTPNPCVICNKRMKFGSLLQKAQVFGADYIATGHYAKVERDSGGGYLLRKGRDAAKDQSYFLFTLSQEQLSRVIFPLGKYKKERVREMAREFGLKVHDKPASQEICFIPDNDYRKFLREKSGKKVFLPGPIVDKDNKVAGEHSGIAFYTVGQRKGIGYHKKPFYVISIDGKKNKIIIGEDKELYTDMLVAAKANWISGRAPENGMRIKARIRYRHAESGAVLFPLDKGKVRVKFDEPQRAVTPGQAAVFYDGETVLGGGWIC